jgi:hypothetical protein
MVAGVFVICQHRRIMSRPNSTTINIGIATVGSIALLMGLDSMDRADERGAYAPSATPLPDDMAMAIPDDLRSVATALGNLINTLHARDLEPEQMPMIPPYRLDDCGWVANRWCELLPMPLDQKQRMMALDSPLLRLELVSDLLIKNGLAK